MLQLHVGKIVEVKDNFFLCVIHKIKVLDEPLYLAIQVHKSPVIIHNRTIIVAISEQQNNWYPEQIPFFLSNEMLNKLEIKDTCDQNTTNSLAFDNMFMNNTLRLLGEILIPIMSRKYPKEQCEEAYNQVLQQFVYG